MAKLNGIQLKRARLVPSSVFTSPDAVVRSAELSRAQKIQILRRWEFDCRRPASGGHSDAGFDGMLSQVQGALALLGALPPLRGTEADVRSGGLPSAPARPPVGH